MPSKSNSELGLGEMATSDLFRILGKIAEVPGDVNQKPPTSSAGGLGIRFAMDLHWGRDSDTWQVEQGEVAKQIVK